MKTHILTISLFLVLAPACLWGNEPFFNVTELHIPTIPSAAGANSDTKYVTAVGTLRIVFAIRTAALFNSGGRSTYVISLRRGIAPKYGQSGTEVASKTVTTDNTNVAVDMTIPISTCADVGAYYVRITNTSTDNPQAGIAGNLSDGFISAVSADPESRTFSMSGFSLLDFDGGDEKTVSIGLFPKPGSCPRAGPSTSDAR